MRKEYESSFNVLNVMSYGGYVLHIGTVEKGMIRKGDHCTCCVDYERRMLIAPNHTLTHMMNWALRLVLQTDTDQKGSLVDDQKLISTVRNLFHHHNWRRLSVR